MTASETRFRNYLNKNYPKAFIKKVADPKQGTTGNIGMPDYLIIDEGETIWYEVKVSKQKNTIPLSIISESQYICFNKMNTAGAKIIIAVYTPKGLYTIPYYLLQTFKFDWNDKSVTIDAFEKYKVD